MKRCLISAGQQIEPCQSRDHETVERIKSEVATPVTDDTGQCEDVLIEFISSAVAAAAAAAAAGGRCCYWLACLHCEHLIGWRVCLR